jgi:hypothetical protein
VNKGAETKQGDNSTGLSNKVFGVRTNFSMESYAMEQIVQTMPRHTRIREFLIDVIEFVESLPLLRPRWVAFDVAIVILLFWN